MGVLGIWEVGKGGGPLFPKLNVKILPIFSVFGENQNVPKGIKCKINTKIFFWIRGSQKGGGDPTFGKNSQIIPYFFLRVYLLPNKARILPRLSPNSPAMPDVHEFTTHSVEAQIYLIIYSPHRHHLGHVILNRTMFFNHRFKVWTLANVTHGMASQKMKKFLAPLALL